MTSPGDTPLTRFANENNLDLDILLGKPYQNKHGISADPYTLEQGESCTITTAHSINEQVTGVRIAFATRFANSLMQITNAFNVSTSIGANTLYLPCFWYLKSGRHMVKPGLHIYNSHDTKPKSSDLILAGMYLKIAALAPLVKKTFSTRKVFRKLRHLLNLELGSAPYGENDLVVHIRSGDIFTKPHKNYGQPPLAFYKKVVRSKSWDKVFVVYENLLNPVIIPLLNWLPQHCNAVATVSGDLKDDLEVLLKAQNLVSGRSTFIPAVCALSLHARNVYYWNDKPFSTWGNKKIRKLGITDVNGFYNQSICRGNWINSLEQQKLMLDYPEENLQLQD